MQNFAAAANGMTPRVVQSPYSAYLTQAFQTLPGNFLNFFFCHTSVTDNFAPQGHSMHNASTALTAHIAFSHSTRWWVWNYFMLPSAHFSHKFSNFCYLGTAHRAHYSHKPARLAGVLYIGTQRRFIGITLSIPQNIQHWEYSRLAYTGVQVAELFNVQHRTILTLSNTLVLRLYGLQRTIKLTQPLLLLMVRLLRRYLVTLKLRCLDIRIGNFGESLPFLWRTLLLPLNEVFNHPRAARLIGDLGVEVGSYRGLGTKLEVRKQLLDFLDQQRAKTIAYFGYIATTYNNPENIVGGGVPSIFTSHFTTLWAMFCRSFLVNCRLMVHPSTGKRLFSNFCLLVSFFQFNANPRRSWVYRKKLRSLKRRLVKRVTREASARVWPF
jgi:hypothetical protein